MSYAMKPVTPTPRPIRPSQTKAMEIIDTAAKLWFTMLPKSEININGERPSKKRKSP